MELLKQVECPANCEGLKVVDINDEVKRMMKKPHHDKDKKMKYLATGLCKAAQPLSIAWNMLLDFDFQLKQSAHKHGDPEEEASFVSIGEKTFDLAEMIRQMELGLKLISICHVQTVQKRRLDLQYLLAPSAKELALEKQEITEFMFGDNMQQAHKDILAKNKVTALTSTPKKKTLSHKFSHSPKSPFLGQGRGSRACRCGAPCSNTRDRSGHGQEEFPSFKAILLHTPQMQVVTTTTNEDWVKMPAEAVPQIRPGKFLHLPLLGEKDVVSTASETTNAHYRHVPSPPQASITSFEKFGKCSFTSFTGRWPYKIFPVWMVQNY